MSDLLSICQHITSKKTKVMNVPAYVDTYVDFLPVSSTTTERTTARLMKSRGAAVVPPEDKETEVKTRVRFPKQTPYCEELLVQISNCAKIMKKITTLANNHSRETSAL